MAATTLGIEDALSQRASAQCDARCLGCRHNGEGGRHHVAAVAKKATANMTRPSKQERDTRRSTKTVSCDVCVAIVYLASVCVANVKREQQRMCHLPSPTQAHPPLAPSTPESSPTQTPAEAVTVSANKSTIHPWRHRLPSRAQPETKKQRAIIQVHIGHDQSLMISDPPPCQQARVPSAASATFSRGQTR